MENEPITFFIDNYRSFDGKVTVGPFKDFTVLIGPNVTWKNDILDAILYVTSDILDTRTFTELVFPGRDRASVSLKYGSLQFTRVITLEGSKWQINNGDVEKTEFRERLKSDIRMTVNNVKQLIISKDDVRCVMNGNHKEVALLVDQIISPDQGQIEYTKLKHEEAVAKEKLKLTTNKHDLILAMIDVNRKMAMANSCNIESLEARLGSEMKIWYKSELFKSNRLFLEETSKSISVSETSKGDLEDQHNLASNEVDKLIQDMAKVKFEVFKKELELLRKRKEKVCLVARLENTKERLQKSEKERDHIHGCQKEAQSEMGKTRLSNPFMEVDTDTQLLESETFVVQSWKEDIELLNIRKLKLEIQKEEFEIKIGKIKETLKDYNTELSQVKDKVTSLTSELLENSREMKNLMEEMESLDNRLKKFAAKKSEWYVDNWLEILELVLKSYSSGVRGRVRVPGCNQINAIVVDDDQQRERCIKYIEDIGLPIPTIISLQVHAVTENHGEGSSGVFSYPFIFLY